MNEGVNVAEAQNKILIDIIGNFYIDKPFVYITNRINSYSVDPHIYPVTAKVKNLVGFAVVSKEYKAKVNAKIEQMFFNKPFEIFSTLEEAQDWANDLVKKN